MKAYSLDLRSKKIVEAVRRGVSISETAHRFGVNRSTVGHYLKRLDKGGSLASKKAPGSRSNWMRAACGCLRKTSRLVRGLLTGTGRSFSWRLAALR